MHSVNILNQVVDVFVQMCSLKHLNFLLIEMFLCHSE